MKTRLLILFYFAISALKSQTFNGTVLGGIRDNNTEVCFPINVLGVGPISATYGLARVCLTVKHAFDGDLEIRLKAPDGTVVPLSIRNGGGGDNYANTCFTGVAASSITSGFPPYTGNFLPQGFLGSVNNNQNADGIWSLCFKDVSRPDSGTLMNWSLLFSNAPAPQPPPPPVNDNPCTALELPVANNCTYSFFSNYSATNSPGVPPPNCANYLGGDVWFTVAVPSSGIVQVDTKAGIMTDGGMAFYTGTLCTNLTLLKCDDNSSANGYMPMLSASGLTPNSTLWIRVWENRNDNNGTFGICATTPPPQPSCSGNPPAGNTCFVASQICNSEGFCGNTSSAYTVDVWPELSAAFNCGTIQNNSFIKFTAASTSVSFNVWVKNSTKNSGIQMMIYSGGCGLGPVTRFACYSRIPPSVFIPTLVTATGLTPGAVYYIMVDGFNGDVCNYVISANTGVNILTVSPTTAASPNICKGQSVQLTASGGNNVYSWSPATGLSATTGSNVIASPDTTTTNTITSTAPTGCLGTVTKDIIVTVNPKPNLGVDKSITICDGSALDLTTLYATTSLGTVWTFNGVVVSDPANVSVVGFYRLIATNSTGCTDTAMVELIVNNKLHVGSDKVAIFCPGSSVDLTTFYSTTGYTSSWTFNGGIVSNPQSVTIAGIYQLIISDGVSCPDTALLTISFSNNLPGPPFIVNICPKQIPYIWNTKSYTVSGIYYDTLTSSMGCDSIITLQLIIKSNSYSTTNVSICSSLLPYFWNGKSYNASGIYYDTSMNAVGCDSIAALQLTVKAKSYSTTDIGICESQKSFFWNGKTYIASGIYYDTLINSVGCDSIASLQLTIKPEPGKPVASSNSPVCSGKDLQLSVLDISGASYNWTGPGGFVSKAQNPSISSVTTTNGGLYFVNAMINGCSGVTDTANVAILQSPIVNAGVDKQVYEGDTVVLTPYTSATNVSYVWTPDDFILNSDSVKNPLVLGVENITYSLIVRNNNCDSKPDEVFVKVLPRIKPFNIPNSFSPNGDGINDVWNIKDLAAYPNATINVFTRYGQNVFSSTGNTKFWDGTKNNNALSSGIYYYIINMNQTLKPLTGWVAIVK